MLFVLISLWPFLSLSPQLIFNSHLFLLPSFLLFSAPAHTLSGCSSMPCSLPFTKVSLQWELWKVNTTHACVSALVSSCLLLGACTGVLPVPRSCSPPPSRPKQSSVYRHRGLSEVEGLCTNSFFQTLEQAAQGGA